MANKITKSLDWFKSRKATAGFALAALIVGFLFLNHSLTGNVILSDKYSFSFVSLIGLVLVGCSLVLAAYSVKNK